MFQAKVPGRISYCGCSHVYRAEVFLSERLFKVQIGAPKTISRGFKVVPFLGCIL